MAAIRCKRPNRSTARPGRSSRWPIRRRNIGWRSILSPATASDFTHGCILRRPPRRWRRAAPRAGRDGAGAKGNPLDSVWTERPAPPLGPVAIHGRQFSGEIEAEKLKRIRLEIAKLGVDALVLSDSHAVAWTFNIRGADVSHTPLPLSYAVVPKDGRPTVFIDHRKLSNAARDHLEQSADVRGPDALTPALTALAQRGGSIALDSATAADALSRLIGGAGGKAVRGSDPVALLKAGKNLTEIKGTQTAP